MASKNVRKEAIASIMEGMQTIRRKLMSKHLAKDITFSQWAVLATLRKKENVGIKEIAKELGITPSATTQLVDELVSKGYLIKKESARDARALSIRLSNEQRQNMNKFRAKRMEKLSAVFSILTDEELSTYAFLNKKIGESFLTSK